MKATETPYFETRNDHAMPGPKRIVASSHRPYILRRERIDMHQAGPAIASLVVAGPLNAASTGARR